MLTPLTLLLFLAIMGKEWDRNAANSSIFGVMGIHFSQVDPIRSGLSAVVRPTNRHYGVPFVLTTPCPHSWYSILYIVVTLVKWIPIFGVIDGLDAIHCLTNNRVNNTIYSWDILINRSYSKYSSLFIIVFFLGFIACGSGGGETSNNKDAEPLLSIISTNPVNNAAVVDINSVVTIAFESDIDPASLPAAFAISNGVTGALSYDPSTFTVTFTPSNDLDYMTTYKITINTNLKSISGKALTIDYEWSFTTAGQPFSYSTTNLNVALLDLTARNGELSTSTTGLSQALDIMGISYKKTEDVSEALQYKIIYTSSYIGSGTLTDAEKQSIINYITGGGVIVSTNVSDSDLYTLFGITGEVKLNTRYSLVWQINVVEPALKYIDDPKEETVSLGSKTYAGIIYTRGYSTDLGVTLAKFDDGSSAIVRSDFGKGKAYLLGFSYTDIILRNQTNLDYEAERSYMNDFEPTTDTFMLFLRGIHEECMQYAIWKHTSPNSSKASLIITHDLDSQSSMDLMAHFADMEAKYGVSSTYNISTHYIEDFVDNDFYTPNISKINYILGKGHSVGSHSVGHFPDWDNEIVIPMGNPGNTKEQYKPHYDGQTTTGATVFGELEVSKQLLENDLGVKVKTFRSGHLLWNDYQIRVLEILGYQFDSSFSANTVLTNFPYLCQYDRSVAGGMSGIYEFPLTISDSNLDGSNNADTVSVWLDVLIRNARNNALTILLIHPNRDYKVLAEESFLTQLPSGIETLDMDSFGTYWKARNSFSYTSAIENNILVITVQNTAITAIHEGISLRVRNGNRLSGISIKASDGRTMGYTAVQYNSDDIIIYGFNL